MRLFSSSAASTRLLRHLAIVMIGVATLGGCAYGPGGGGYYAAPSAFPGDIYGYPAGSFGVGGVWIGGGHNHWNNGWHHWHGHPGSPGIWHSGGGNWHGAAGGSHTGGHGGHR
jgi:hypothetical protein